MARLTRLERRDAIIDAALAVARRKGLATTTVRDIATEMGTSSGLVHHYFESMDDVLSDAFARAAHVDLDEVSRAVAECSSPVAALRTFFDTYMAPDSDWTFQLWLDAWSEATRRPALRETSARLNVAWQQLVANILRDGSERADFECDDPEAAAWRIISLLDGLALQVVAHRTVLTRERILGWARRAAETELGLASGMLEVATAG